MMKAPQTLASGGAEMKSKKRDRENEESIERK